VPEGRAALEVAELLQELRDLHDDVEHVLRRRVVRLP
jgi:hypothetical protein